MWHRGLFFGCLVGLLLLATGCASVSGPSDDGDIVFSEDILPVLQESFVPLLSEDSGLDASSWESLIRGSNEGEVLIPFDAERSLLIEAAEAAGPNGPDTGDLSLVRRWIESGAPNDDGEIPYDDADQLLYVANQGSAVISVIDMEANLVIRTVDLQDLGFSENAKPHHIAVAPDGSFWYVSLIGENTVLKFNRDNELVERVAFEVPGMLALDHTADRLYVGRSMSAVNPPQRIGIIERSGMEIEELDVFYPRPHALNLTTEGDHLYSASLAVNQMASIDPNSMEVEIHDIEGPHHSLVQFAASPIEPTLIAGGEMSGQLLFFDISEPMQPKVAKTLDLGGAPWHPSFLPDGSRAFVPRKMANAVSVIDMATRSEAGVVSGRGIAEPHGSAVRPDGRYVYVSSNNLKGGFEPRYAGEGDPNGAIAVIDTETLEIVKVIEVENYPTGVGARSAR